MDFNAQEFIAYLKLVLPFLSIGKDKQTCVMAYRHPAALVSPGKQFKNCGTPFQISLMSVLLSMLNKAREDCSVFALVYLAKMGPKNSLSFSFSRILTGFVVKLDDLFFIWSTYKLKTMLISPETKHRHLNFILVSMNDCACARL